MGRTRRKDTAEAGGTVPPFPIAPVRLGSAGLTLREPLVLGRRGTNASEWQTETDLRSQGEGGMWEKGAEWTSVTVSRHRTWSLSHDPGKEEEFDRGPSGLLCARVSGQWLRAPRAPSGA